MRKQNTIEDCHKLSAIKGGKCLSIKYIKTNTKYCWQCNIGHQWQATYNNILQGKWCPECNCYKKITIIDCHKLATKQQGKFLSKECVNNRTKYLWECAKGHTWKATYTHIQQGTWCPECGGTFKGNINDCYQLAKKKNGKCLSIEYINSRTKYLWECKAGHKWDASLNNVRRGSWCPACSNRKPKTIEFCNLEARKYGGNCLSNKYINAHTKYIWKCKNKHKWEATYHNIQSGKWCPKCLHKTQTYIYEICKELFPNYDIKYNFKEFDWLKTNKNAKQELDIYIQELSLAIEYDGEQHFRPVCFGGISLSQAQENLSKQQKRDKLKEQKIKAHPKDIKYFIRFNYTETLTKKYILNKIEKSISEVI